LVAQYKLLRAKHHKEEQAFLHQSELVRRLKRFMSQLQMGADSSIPKAVPSQLVQNQNPGVPKQVAAPVATKPAAKAVDAEFTIHFDEFID
jgi:hypothetical protein